MQFQVKCFDELTPAELYEILRARNEVFLLEQGIVCLDTDGVDYRALHVFAMKNGNITAYLRAFADETCPDTVMIGRVLTRTRGCGDGRALMQYAMRAVALRIPCQRFALHAQCHAAGFYEKCGFHAVGVPFMEEGVAHILMETETIL